MKRVRLEGPYRLITRSDMDGVVCGALLQMRNMVDSILFAHPKDMQDGTVEVSKRDLIANLPYVPGCVLAFGRKNSVEEPLRSQAIQDGSLVCQEEEGSVARLIYTYLGGRLSLPRLDTEMLDAVDRSVTAQFRREDILEPSGWTLLSFLMDARTGLGRFRDFRISNYQLLMNLVPMCRSHSIQEILRQQDVSERVALYGEHQVLAAEQIQRCAQMHGDVIVVDLRGEDTIYAANRFLVYALYPQAKVSIHVLWGLRRMNTVYAVGRSILNPESSAPIGSILQAWGGGGHDAAGTCQVSHEKAEPVLQQILQALNQNGF